MGILHRTGRRSKIPRTTHTQRGINRVVVVLISSSVDPIAPFFFVYDLFLPVSRIFFLGRIARMFPSRNDYVSVPVTYRGRREQKKRRKQKRKEHWNNEYRAIQKVKNNRWMKSHDQKDRTDTCAYQAEQHGEHNGECRWTIRGGSVLHCDAVGSGQEGETRVAARLGRVSRGSRTIQQC